MRCPRGKLRPFPSTLGAAIEVPPKDYLFLFKSLFFLEDKGPVFESFNKTFGKIEKCYNGHRSKNNHLTSPVGTLVIA